MLIKVHQLLIDNQYNTGHPFPLVEIRRNCVHNRYYSSRLDLQSANM